MVDLTNFENGEIFSPLQKQLMNMLEENGPMTRPQMVKEVAKPRTTVYDNLMRLYQHNIVKKFSRPTNNRGRPHTFFRLLEEQEN